MITCFLNGTAIKTPKNAIAKHQSTISPALKKTGPPGLSSNVIICSAGMIPTNPAANGIVPVATAIDWRTMFSAGPKGVERKGFAALKIAKPRREDWRDIIEIQPVWRPKYMFVKQRSAPIPMPTPTARH